MISNIIKIDFKTKLASKLSNWVEVKVENVQKWHRWMQQSIARKYLSIVKKYIPAFSVFILSSRHLIVANRFYSTHTGLSTNDKNSWEGIVISFQLNFFFHLCQHNVKTNYFQIKQVFLFQTVYYWQCEHDQRAARLTYDCFKLDCEQKWFPFIHGVVKLRIRSVRRGKFSKIFFVKNDQEISSAFAKRESRRPCRTCSDIHCFLCVSYSNRLCTGEGQLKRLRRMFGSDKCAIHNRTMHSRYKFQAREGIMLSNQHFEGETMECSTL